MAQLPPDGQYLIQQIDGKVILFERHTEEELVKFDPTDGDAVAKAQYTIHTHPDLDEQQRCFAHFWSGYFYAHANNEPEL